MDTVNWSPITEGATSSNLQTRKHSLHQAVTEVEKALRASGQKRKRGQSLADMFLSLVETDPSLK